jgi:hypothetical protein
MRIGNRRNTAVININAQGIRARFEPHAVRNAARPGDVRAPQRDKPALTFTSPSVDLEIVDVSRIRRTIIANREQVVILIVGESQHEPAIVCRIDDCFHPAVVQRSGFSNQNTLKAHAISLKGIRPERPRISSIGIMGIPGERCREHVSRLWRLCSRYATTRYCYSDKKDSPHRVIA